MEIVKTTELLDGNILAKDVLDYHGNAFLIKGTVLTYRQIDKLKALGIMYVAIEASNRCFFEDVDNKMNIIKDKMTDVLPGFFYRILNKDNKLFKVYDNIVDEMIDYITKTGEINTNIFELGEYEDYNYIHCVDTCIMATFIGMKMEVKNEELKKLALGALLHDIGKEKAPRNILNKKGKLTLDEFNEIKKHTINGDQILKDASINSRIIRDITMQHHEYVNGTGYPNNLFSEEISQFAKIVSLCDVFTALCANRSYRNCFNPNDAYEFIISNSNTMFDPKVVHTFKENFVIYPKGCKVRISNGIVGTVTAQNKGFPDRPIIKVYYESGKTKQIKIQKINLLEFTNLVIEEIVL